MPVAAVIAESAEALELSNLAELVADSPWFRAVIANPDAEYSVVTAWAADSGEGGDYTVRRDDALAKIVYGLVDEELNGDDPMAQPPRVIIRHMGDQSATKVAVNDVSQRADLLCLFELVIPEAYIDRTQANFRNAWLYGLNIAGGFRRDLLTHTGRPNRLFSDAVTMADVGFYDWKNDTNNVLTFFADFMVRCQGT